MKQNRKLLVAVTGASGFLGSRMVPFLKEKGHTVRAILRKHNPQTKEYYSQSDKIVYADLSDMQATRRALRGAHFVFHFAADMGGVGYFSKQQYVPFVTNMRMDLNILAACEQNGVKRLFYPSSACAYPIDAATRLRKIPKLEETMFLPANPDQMYGWEKLTMLLLSSHAPVETRVGVLHTIFGPGQEWSGARAKFPPAITYKVIQAARTKSPIRIWGDGKQLRTFLYISDALEKIYEVMMAKDYWGPVNISGDQQVTVKECADWLAKLAGIKPVYVFEKDKPTGVMLRGVNNDKYKKHYAYRNKVSTKKGFSLLYEYMRERIKEP